MGKEVGTVPRVVGTGRNLGLLPGDLSSPSRFVRLFYQKQIAQSVRAPQTHEEAFSLSSALISSVFIPYGATDHEGEYELTRWTVMKVLGSGKKEFYWRGYYNTQWRKVDMDSSSLDFTTPVRFLVNPEDDLGVKDAEDLFSGGGNNNNINSNNNNDDDDNNSINNNNDDRTDPEVGQQTAEEGKEENEAKDSEVQVQ